MLGRHQSLRVPPGPREAPRAFHAVPAWSTAPWDNNDSLSRDEIVTLSRWPWLCHTADPFSPVCFSSSSAEIGPNLQFRIKVELQGWTLFFLKQCRWVAQKPGFPQLGLVQPQNTAHIVCPFCVPSPWTNSQLLSKEQVSKLNHQGEIWFGRVCVCHTHCRSIYFTKGDCFHPNNAQLSDLLWVRVTSLSGWTFKLWLSGAVIRAGRDHL